MIKSKTYTMWLCDSCEDGIEHSLKTKHWKKGQKCSYCFEGRIQKQKVKFEITDIIK